jgi:hypothetical protein
MTKMKGETEEKKSGRDCWVEENVSGEKWRGEIWVKLDWFDFYGFLWKWKSWSLLLSHQKSIKMQALKENIKNI